MFKVGLERAEHVLALDCHAPLSILNRTTQTKEKKRETTRQGRGRQGQTNARRKAGKKWLWNTFFQILKEKRTFIQDGFRFNDVDPISMDTDLVQNKQNYATIENIHNFARHMLQQLFLSGYALTSFCYTPCCTIQILVMVIIVMYYTLN